MVCFCLFGISPHADIYRPGALTARQRAPADQCATLTDRQPDSWPPVGLGLDMRSDTCLAPYYDSSFLRVQRLSGSFIGYLPDKLDNKRKL